MGPEKQIHPGETVVVKMNKDRLQNYLTFCFQKPLSFKGFWKEFRVSYFVTISRQIWLITILCCLYAWITPVWAGQNITDSRGVMVKLPENIQRVATISDGFIEGVMTVLGVQDKLVAVGSTCIQRTFKYSYPTVKGEDYTYVQGMNPVLYLNPKIKNLPLIGKPNSPIHYETLVNIDPDLVIVRVGSCTLRHLADENTMKSVEMMESLGIPVVVIHGSNCYKKPDLSQITHEIRILGEVFNRPIQAKKLSDYLEAQTAFIKERTKDIKAADKVTTLIFGLSPKTRKAGGAGQVFGLDTIESYFIEAIANGKNAYDEPGYFRKINTEQVLAIDPDVIVLCTAWGYHPPKELYQAPYYQNLSDLKAVKNRRVSALPWSPCNCSKRLEYPIDAMVIAKASYPEKFRDIDLAQWLINFYRNVYGVDTATAKKLRSAQWMDWTLDK